MVSKKLSLSVLCAVHFIFGAPAWAAVNCTGPVVSTAIGPDGDFTVDLGYSRIRICNANNPMTVYRGAGSTLPVTLTSNVCTNLMAFFMTGEASRQTVLASVDRTDCNMGDGVYPNPYPTTFKFTP